MRKLLENKLSLIIIITLAMIISVSLRKTRLKTEYSALVLSQKEASVTKLQSEVDQLRQEKSKLKNQWYQERIIRDELLMQKPGEVVVQLPELTESSVTTPTPTPTPTNFDQWRELLFH